jgi:hypothetical protein
MALTTVTGSMITPSTTLSGDVTVTGTMVMGSSFMRNRIINGDFRIDQRNAGASVTPTAQGVLGVDRWFLGLSAASKYSVQQNAGSVTPPAGFTNYMGITSLAATTVGSTDYYYVEQKIEGFNTSDLAWGSANAKTVTLSFWVRSSLTGQFGGRLTNSDESRSYPIAYTINSANTWEQKTITITGDTTGTWLTTNGIGLKVTFSIGMGSTYCGTANVWAGTVYGSSTGSTNLVSTNGATFYITGVQLEVGSSATPFERRLYNQELANCQRYWTALGMASTTNTFPSISGTICNIATATASSFVQYGIRFPSQMRTAPTIVFASVDGTLGVVRNAATGATYSVTSYETNSIQLANITATGITSGMYIHNQFSANAEL